MSNLQESAVCFNKGNPGCLPILYFSFYDFGQFNSSSPVNAVSKLSTLQHFFPFQFFRQAIVLTHSKNKLQNVRSKQKAIVKQLSKKLHQKSPCYIYTVLPQKHILST